MVSGQGLPCPETRTPDCVIDTLEPLRKSRRQRVIYTFRANAYHPVFIGVPSNIRPSVDQDIGLVFHFHLWKMPEGGPETSRVRNAAFKQAGRRRMEPRFTARDTTQSNSPETSSNLEVATLIFGILLEASRRKTPLRISLSTKVVVQSGRVIATGIPGNPAPEPKSQIVRGPGGGKPARKTDSATCLRTASFRSRIGGRLSQGRQPL